MTDTETPEEGALKVVCLSDTHGRHDYVDVPDGDILIHAGDFTVAGEFVEIVAFNEWLGSLPHRHKIVIAGNHDLMFERDPGLARGLLGNAIYLQDSGVEIKGLKIYGSPWQPWFMDWAFNVRVPEYLAAKWAAIPDDTDILVTHGPPLGVLDAVPGGERVGCDELRKRLITLRPKLHVFGHIHHSYGERRMNSRHFINAAICDEAYRPVNRPIVAEVVRSRSEVNHG